MRLRSVAAGTALVALAAVGPATSCVAPGNGAGKPDAATSDTAKWQPCPTDLLKSTGVEQLPAKVTFECTTVKVPVDWRNEARPRRLDIAVIRARHQSQHDRLGAIMVNPGGPGGSGVDSAVSLAGELPADIMQRFDLIGFDPRGVKRSAPIDCGADTEDDALEAADPDPLSPEQFNQEVELARKIGQACQTKYGEELPLFATNQSARDMEAIRRAIGEPKVNYLGWSYGTLLGAVYAHLHAGNIRTLVLDGAVDPRQDDVAIAEGQAKGFELAFTNFAAWCRAAGGTCAVGPDARTFLVQLMARARTKPVVAAGGKVATAGLLHQAVVNSLYTRSSWDDLAAALAKLNRGDATDVLKLAAKEPLGEGRRNATRGPARDVSDAAADDATTVIDCADSRRSPSVDEVRRLQAEWRAKYPLFGPAAAMGMLTCALWPGKRDPAQSGEAKTSAPALIISSRGDPATPYEQAGGLATVLDRAVVLTYDGEGHGVYPRNPCVNGLVNKYLLETVVTEAAGKSCPPA